MTKDNEPVLDSLEAEEIKTEELKYPFIFERILELEGKWNPPEWVVYLGIVIWMITLALIDLMHHPMLRVCLMHHPTIVPCLK